MCLVLSLSVFASISLSLSLYFASHFHAVPQPRRPEAVFDIFFEFLANYFSDPRIVNPDLKEVLLEVLSVCLSSLSLLLSLSLSLSMFASLRGPAGAVGYRCDPTAGRCGRAAPGRSAARPQPPRRLRLPPVVPGRESPRGTLQGTIRAQFLEDLFLVLIGMQANGRRNAGAAGGAVPGNVRYGAAAADELPPVRVRAPKLGPDRVSGLHQRGQSPFF